MDDVPLFSTWPEQLVLGILVGTFLVLDVRMAILTFGTGWLHVLGWIMWGILIFDIIFFVSLILYTWVSDHFRKVRN